MKSIFICKPFTGDPADGTDNAALAIFGRFDAAQFTIFVDAPAAFMPFGPFKKIKLKNKNKFLRLLEKIILLRRLRPNFLMGTGTVLDLPLVLGKSPHTRYLIHWHSILRRHSAVDWRVRTPWWLRKFIFRRAAGVLTVSQFAKESILTRLPRIPVAAVLNGVEISLFHPDKRNYSYLEKKYGLTFKKPAVVFVGVLQARKRPTVFIELAKNYAKANFIMVGRKFTSYPLTIPPLENLTWIERMPREDIAALFGSAELFIFPSLNEPSAAVILEAMASGCIPIVSKSGGNPEFFTDGKEGFLIDVAGDEQKRFIEKIEFLLVNGEVRRKMSIAARAKAEKHSWDAVAREYEKVFLSL